MACVSGVNHTVTLADNGEAHSFGLNDCGQLGLGHNNNVSLPKPIPNLPKIKQIACGQKFTVIVDYEGFIWSFGENKYGQLGTGNKTDFNVPQKILEIPPVLSVDCGYEHTLIITNDSNLWSCGNNSDGQLCLGNKENQLKPQKTSFSNISKVSAGYQHSLFQDCKKEIFACGSNKCGECGLGHFNSPQITVSRIPNLPYNFVQFSCGYYYSLFLDSEGNVFSVGSNQFGQLGLNCTNQCVMIKIPNIPPIKTISCVYPSSYLIDFDGNVWSFGYNNEGQLGHGVSKNTKTPKIIPNLKNIQQISYGSCGLHFLAKNSQNEIFGIGKNNLGQLGTGDNQSALIPKLLHQQYFTIWGNKTINNNPWNDVYLTMNWNKKDMENLQLIQSKINQVKIKLESNNNDKSKQEFPPNSFETWNEVQQFLNEKFQQINLKLDQKQEIQTEKNVKALEIELQELESSIQKLQKRKKEIEDILLPTAKIFTLEENFKEIENNQKILKEMCSDVSTFCENENLMNQDLARLFEQKQFEEFDCSDISKLLWKMDLTKYQSLFEENQINGAVVSVVDDEVSTWKQLGIDKQDCFRILYHFKMMKCSGYVRTFSHDYEHDCCVCYHATPEKTMHLLKEYDIQIEDEFILKNKYTAPMLISKIFLKDLLGKDFFSQQGIQLMSQLDKWKRIHENHLKNLSDK